MLNGVSYNDAESERIVDMFEQVRVDYGIDIALDDMVYAAIKVNPRQGGKLNGYDSSAATEMRGVEKVIEITNGETVDAKAVENKSRKKKAA